ncbi:MAG: hypothetical protein AB7V42_08800 [Thermoleophilia bacterium]
MNGEKLWHYAGLARLWSWALVAVAAIELPFAILVQGGSDQGLSGRWFLTMLGMSAGTGVLLYPAFRVWLRPTALPSVRLPQAVRATGPRRLEASPRDWRRWAAVTVLILLAGSSAMLLFLVGVLGRGGTAEGVVVGILAAWGFATLEDSRRIRAVEREEGRLYYAACRRPTGVGGKLVWMPGRPAQGERPRDAATRARGGYR